MRTQSIFGWLLLATLVNVGSVDLRAQQETWVRLHSAKIGADAATLTMSLPDDSPRVRSIKLAALNGAVSLRRVQVTYGNGQVPFDERAVPLQPNERTPDIDERAEARVVQSIDVTLQKEASPPARAEIEVWGLKPPESQKPRGE